MSNLKGEPNQSAFILKSTHHINTSGQTCPKFYKSPSRSLRNCPPSKRRGEGMVSQIRQNLCFNQSQKQALPIKTAP